MVDEFHNDVLRSAGAFETGHESDPGRMEGEMRQADALQEFVPVKANHGSLLRALVSQFASLLAKGFKERDERGIQLGFVIFVPLGAKEDGSVFEVHVAMNVHVGFGNAAALMQGDFERDPQNVRPGILGTVLNEVGGIVDLGADEGDFGVANFRLWASGLLFESKVGAGVGLNVAPFEGFAHEDAEEFKFEQGSVMGNFSQAFGWKPCASPAHEINAMLADHLSWVMDAQSVKIGEKGLQAVQVALAGVAVVGVAGFDIGLRPGVKVFAFGSGDDLGFFGGEVRAKLPRATVILADSDSELGGFANAFESGRLAPFYPPEGAVWSFVKAGHECVPVCLVCPVVQHESTKINTFQQESTTSNGECYTGGSNPPLSATSASRGYDSCVPRMCLRSWVFLSFIERFGLFFGFIAQGFSYPTSEIYLWIRGEFLRGLLGVFGFRQGDRASCERWVTLATGPLRLQKRPLPFCFGASFHASRIRRTTGGGSRMARHFCFSESSRRRLLGSPPSRSGLGSGDSGSRFCFRGDRQAAVYFTSLDAVAPVRRAWRQAVLAFCFEQCGVVRHASDVNGLGQGVRLPGVYPRRTRERQDGTSLIAQPEAGSSDPAIAHSFSAGRLSAPIGNCGSAENEIIPTVRRFSFSKLGGAERVVCNMARNKALPASIDLNEWAEK